MTADINTIALHADCDEDGWGHRLLFGTDMDRGWTLECDMEDGELTAAFTPAGLDPMFLLTAKPESAEEYAASVVSITVEGAGVHWNPATRTLTMWNTDADPEGLTDQTAMSELLRSAQSVLRAEADAMRYALERLRESVAAITGRVEA